MRIPFSTKTNYPKQSLSDKQKNLLDAMDTFLVEDSNSKLMSNPLSIKTFKIGIYSQHLTINSIFNNFCLIFKDIEFAYIPRTISLVVDADGTWCFYIGIRNNSTTNTDVLLELYLDSLSRTNNSRIS